MPLSFLGLPWYDAAFYSSSFIDSILPWLTIGRGGRDVIKKVKQGYKVLSEKSKKNLGGPYKTKEEAEKRLRQVEFFKRRKG
jgi:hypothetical protein